MEEVWKFVAISMVAGALGGFTHQTLNFGRRWAGLRWSNASARQRLRVRIRARPLVRHPELLVQRQHEVTYRMVNAALNLVGALGFGGLGLAAGSQNKGYAYWLVLAYAVTLFFVVHFLTRAQDAENDCRIATKLLVRRRQHAK
jgi:hypothetical protein